MVFLISGCVDLASTTCQSTFVHIILSLGRDLVEKPAFLYCGTDSDGLVQVRVILPPCFSPPAVRDSHAATRDSTTRGAVLSSQHHRKAFDLMTQACTDAHDGGAEHALCAHECAHDAQLSDAWVQQAHQERGRGREQDLAPPRDHDGQGPHDDASPRIFFCHPKTLCHFIPAATTQSCVRAPKGCV